MAVGPKYLKYGTCVRLPELKEVRPKQDSRGQYRDMQFRQAWEPLGSLLLSGVSTTS